MFLLKRNVRSLGAKACLHSLDIIEYNTYKYISCNTFKMYIILVYVKCLKVHTKACNRMNTDDTNVYEQVCICTCEVLGITVSCAIVGLIFLSLFRVTKGLVFPSLSFHAGAEKKIACAPQDSHVLSLPSHNPIYN